MYQVMPGRRVKSEGEEGEDRMDMPLEPLLPLSGRKND
jgi:hypothetical protein